MPGRAFIALGNFLFRVRNGLFPLLVPLVLLPGRPLAAEPLRAVLAGLLIAAAGQLVRVATIGLRYIIRGGRNLYLDGIEHHLMPHPAIRETAVVGVPGGLGGEHEWAFVTLEDGASLTPLHVRDH